MTRNINKLKSEKFDLLVIGCGIHGASLAYEAASNGLNVCLIEKDDFGSQTSANSLKVLHGGLRYLQHANFKRMRESIYSRKIFQQIAPHLVKSVPFLIPTKGFAVKSKFALSIAMKLNDLISFDRNRNILKECFVPGGSTISKGEISTILPELNSSEITGGAVWYESVATNTERLLFEFLHKAADNGATLLNYVKAEKYNLKDNLIETVSVNDEQTNTPYEIKAKKIVNTVGPWLNEILSGTNDLEKLESPLTKAVNIIVKGNLFENYAVGIESIKEFKDEAAIINKGKRLFFFVPLEDYTMIGTTYKIYEDEPENCEISDYDVEEILNEINQAYNGFNLKLEDVTQTHVGLQAAPNIKFKNEFDVQPETHSLIFDHKESGTIENLISIKSVKYTTAPAIASKVISSIKSDYSHKNIDLENYQKLKAEHFSKSDKYSDAILDRLWNTYGPQCEKVLKYIEKDEISRELVFENEKIYNGEIDYCLNEEMAVSANDIIDRRLGLSALKKIDQSYYNKINDKIKAVLV